MTTRFDLAPVTEADFDELVALRIATMRESLERIGRFHPQTAAARFRNTFRPADTRRIVVDGVAAGCVALWPEPLDAMRVEHFYIAAPFQGRGLGGAVLRRLFDSVPEEVRMFRVGALRDSDANRFYQRHGFVKVSEDEWDIAYERPRHLAAG
ncbi:MAG: GNAT family N-acetyltransferase [Burkholderiales bacterium]